MDTMNIKKGNRMTSRRIAILLIAAVGLSLLWAGTAMAATGSGYSGWSASGANATTPTPHAGYATTTVKCAVCHAVHGAQVGGALLLRSSVANSCVYCHITDGISSVEVYDNNSANYTNDFTNNHSSVGGNSDCVDCHAVHGAGTIAAQVQTKILRDLGTEQAIPNGDFTTGTVRNAVVTAYCTQCHAYYAAGYDAPEGGVDYNYHIMASATINYQNPDASAGMLGETVAWAGSNYCSSCHDAGSDTVADNFPHYTDGARFLLSAAYEGAATAGAVDPSEDGACLKCHKDDAVTGVGEGF